MIAFGCDKILMHPEAQIGDIGVISLTEPGGQFERAPEKIVSPFLQFASILAKRKNRPPALLQAMIDKDLEVFQVTNKADGRVTYMSEVEIQAANEEWIQGPMVPESRKGLLLTVNGQRAHELQLADAPCHDEDELRSRLGISEKANLTPVASTWVDTLIAVLNSGVGGFLLITLGIICVYVELHLPSGFFAILATVFFASGRYRRNSGTGAVCAGYGIAGSGDLCHSGFRCIRSVGDPSYIGFSDTRQPYVLRNDGH